MLALATLPATIAARATRRHDRRQQSQTSVVKLAEHGRQGDQGEQQQDRGDGAHVPVDGDPEAATDHERHQGVRHEVQVAPSVAGHGQTIPTTRRRSRYKPTASHPSATLPKTVGLASHGRFSPTTSAR